MAKAKSVRDLMTASPVVLDAKASVAEAAEQMRSRDVGDVLVRDGEKLCGIVTDRDLVLRCMAEGTDARATTLGEVCTAQPATLPPDASVDDAIRLMEEKAIRRIPIVENGQAIGVVSLGDLARDRDPRSALGQISSAPPTH